VTPEYGEINAYRRTEEDVRAFERAPWTASTMEL